MIARLKQYVLLMRFHKPIGILLLLWPALWGLWLAANGTPPVSILAVFIGGVILMRAAGCVMNDFADRHFDGHVRRTKNRPLVTGKVSTQEAIALFCGLSLSAFSLVLLLNRYTILLSLIALALAVSYPFLKRYTHWPQLALGLAFSWSIPMSFAAETQHIPPIAWILFAAAVLWTLVYDTQYAMTDREDDISIGIKSTAILFGRYDRVIIALLQLAVLGLLIIVGYRLQLNQWFYSGLAVAAVIAGYQQFLIRHREPMWCFKAFLNNNWFGLAIFVGFVLGLVK